MVGCYLQVAERQSGSVFFADSLDYLICRAVCQITAAVHLHIIVTLERCRRVIGKNDFDRVADGSRNQGCHTRHADNRPGKFDLCRTAERLCARRRKRSKCALKLDIHFG